MSIELWIVDAFADRPFSGNPAAVALLASFPDDGTMAAIADEVHLSETAFVVPRPDGSHDLRWFTPTTEVDLCGHATLAAAHVLGADGRFHTRSGTLACRHVGSGVVMDFPADTLVVSDLPDLGLDGVRWGGRGRDDVLVVVDDAGQVRGLTPDLGAFAALGSRAVIITAPGDEPGIDMVSRVFAPNVGVPEDPVTGSAHCTLAAYWGPELGRDTLVGFQASRRGGRVEMTLGGDRVAIGGTAVTVGRLELLV